MIDPEIVKQIDSLLYRIQRQDKLALKKLYELSNTRLLSLILRILNDTHEAEDVLQELYIKVWQQANKYSGSGSAWGWLCTLARNGAIDRLRSLKRRSYESTDDSPELLDLLSEANMADDNHWLGQCLAKLKAQTREAILLSYVKGYSHSELSTQLDTPLGTIKAWLRRGMQELKQCLAA